MRARSVQLSAHSWFEKVPLFTLCFGFKLLYLQFFQSRFFLYESCFSLKLYSVP